MTKRKIEIKKRERKEQRSVTCSKRRKTVFSKALDLCRFSGANIGILVTSPVEDSDAICSFSGFSSSAFDIADCYLSDKIPPKLGFWRRQDHNLSEISVFEDRLERIKKDLMSRLDKNEKPQSVSGFDQNPSNSSLEDPSSSSSSLWQIVSTFDQNPSDSSRFVSDFAQASSSLSDISNSKFASFDQDPNDSSSLRDIYSGSSSQIDQNLNDSSRFVSDFAQASSSFRDISNSKFASFGQDSNDSSSLRDIYGGSSSQIDQIPSSSSDEGDDDNSFWADVLDGDLWEAKDEKNNSMSLTQETRIEPVANLDGYDDDEKSFWENLIKDDVLGLNNEPLANEEDHCMIDITQFLNEEEIELLQSDQENLSEASRWRQAYVFNTTSQILELMVEEEEEGSFCSGCTHLALRSHRGQSHALVCF